MKARDKIEGTAPGLHEKVLKMMVQEKRGRALDVPAGRGMLSSHLKEMGFEVWAGDIEKNLFEAKDVKFQKLDLNERLPYPDSFFTYIVCVEGIEHLMNVYQLFQEYGRIIEPNGKLIISTPNILSIFSRLRYLLIGYYDYFGGFFSRENHLYTLHINPMGFPEIYFALKRAGFKIESMTTNRDVISTRKLPLRLLLWFLAFLSKRVTLFKVKDNFMRKILSSRELLRGEILILKCVRK